MDLNKVTKEPAKKVITHAANGNENGWLLELFKDNITGQKTEVYLATTKPGTFKGFHLHRVRRARYVCLKGKVKIITYSFQSGKWVREENILDSTVPERLHIPKNVATGLETIGQEEAWIVNYPDPAYDPALKDEQVEYTQQELEEGILK